MTALPTPNLAAHRPPSRRADDRWLGGNMPIARLGLTINLLVPLALLAWDAYRHQLGVNAVNFALLTTGTVAVTYLLLSLCVSPLRTVTGLNWLTQFRRALGVYAFYYACVHLAIYFWWDRQGSLAGTAFEITHRFYLLIGFTSIAIMTPLWATSFKKTIRLLGGRRWQLLHRLTYLAASLACWHFYLQRKADKRLPSVYFGVLAVLLIWRLIAAGRAKPAASRYTAAPRPSGAGQASSGR